jgi:Protein of unknown function (DUF1501)
MTRRPTTDCEGFYRRDLLKIGAAGLFGLTLPELLRLEATAAERTRKAKGVILIWLGGGPATIDMWDLKPDAPANIRGEFKPIDTSVPGIQISEHLPKMAKLMHKCSIVRSIHHGVPDHGVGTLWMMTGNKPAQTLRYPSLGSLCSKLLPTEPGVPPYITFGNSGAGGAGYLGTAYNPFQVEGSGATMRVRGVSLPQGFSLKDLEDRNKLLEDMDRSFKALDQASDTVSGLDKFHQQALDVLRADKTKKAFDLNSESADVRAKYGADGFGNGALAARRLIEAGVRFVTVTLGGWDTHGQNFNALKTRLLPQVDRTLSALIEDLATKKLLDSTIVYCAGEFGRTPKINKGAGRDHWARSMAVLLAGGGIKGGYAHGSTDVNGMAANREPCTPDDVATTIFHCLGLDSHHEVISTTGRPMSLFREGKVIEKLVN